RTIVAHDVVFVGPDLLRFMLPVTSIGNVRFIKHLTVDQNMTLMERHRLSRQADHAFQVHHMWSGQLYGYDVATPRRVKQVGQAVDEIPLIGLVGGHHADALDPDWQQCEFAYENTGQCPDKCAY